MNQNTDSLHRHTVYKRVKISMPHCNVCGEQLSGNNSQADPYICSCGVWEQTWGTLEFKLKVVKEA